MTISISREGFERKREPETEGLKAGEFYNGKERNGSISYAYAVDGEGVIWFYTAADRKAECG